MHLSYLLEGDDRLGLFGGDVVFQGGKILLLSTPDCSIQDLAATMRRLGELDFRSALSRDMPEYRCNAAASRWTPRCASSPAKRSHRISMPDVMGGGWRLTPTMPGTLQQDRRT